MSVQHYNVRGAIQHSTSTCIVQYSPGKQDKVHYSIANHIIVGKSTVNFTTARHTTLFYISHTSQYLQHNVERKKHSTLIHET